MEKVFDFYKDPRKSWSVGPDRMARRGELIDVRTTEDGVGTFYSWAMHVAGLRLEGFDVFTECIPNQRITDRSSRSFVGTWTFAVEPEGSGTRVTLRRHPVSSWALRPVDRLLDRPRTSVSREQLEKLTSRAGEAQCAGCRVGRRRAQRALTLSNPRRPCRTLAACGRRGPLA